MFSHVGTITPESVFSDPGGALPPIVDARCAARESHNNERVQRLYSNQRAAAAAHWQFPSAPR